MRNHVQEGEVLTLTAPYDVASGGGCLVGETFGVATGAVASGAAGEFATEGVYDLAKTSAQAWAAQDPVHWNVATKLADNDPATGPRIGTALAVAANPTSAGRVKLLGGVPQVKRATVSQGSVAPVSKNTAGAVTVTAAELLTGIIVADPNGAGRTYTLPTAALLVAAVPNAKVGDLVRCTVINGADAAEALTIAEGAGGTWDGNFLAAKTVAQNAARELLIRLTNVTAAAEAYVIYLG